MFQINFFFLAVVFDQNFVGNDCFLGRVFSSEIDFSCPAITVKLCIVLLGGISTYTLFETSF